MDIQDAIKIIEESPDYEQFAKLKKVFKDEIEKLSDGDFTERGVYYYYLLRIVLRSRLMYETEECREYFEKMDEEFKKQLHKYKRDRKKFQASEIADFFRLMERSYGSLEIIFRKKDFFEEERKAYIKKMKYRQHHAWFKHHWWTWFEHTFLEKTSLYGHSFLRWGMTAFFFAMLMSIVYFILDYPLTVEAQRIVAADGHWYDYIYFSIVTMTSLGYGDLTPHTFTARVFASFEVFFGFIMLGIFISLLQKKM